MDKESKIKSKLREEIRNEKENSGWLNSHHSGNLNGCYVYRMCCVEEETSLPTPSPAILEDKAEGTRYGATMAPGAIGGTRAVEPLIAALKMKVHLRVRKQQKLLRRCNIDDPSGIAVDGSGNVYVTDTDINRIQKSALVIM